MLELLGIRKAFGRTVAVDGVSLSVGPGEILGLLGPNGAGKSTAVSMAVGWLAPDEGSVTVAGLGSPTEARVRSRLGVAPQALAIYDELTGEENVAFFGRIQGLAGERLRDRTRRALEFVDLADRRGDRARTYSGGMKRRLNLACAIVHDPVVLLLDEPTVGVDPQSRRAILDRVAGLRAEGKAILYTTHHMDEAEDLCDRIAVIDHGRILALGTLGELLEAHGGKSLVVVEREGRPESRVETDDPIAELERALAGERPRRVRVERPDLEAVFLHLTGRQLRD